MAVEKTASPPGTAQSGTAGSSTAGSGAERRSNRSASGRGRAKESAKNLFKRKQSARGGKTRLLGREEGPKKRVWAMSSDERKARKRGIILRVIAVVAALALCLTAALVVGTADYEATAIGWIPFVACITGIALAFVYVQILARSIRLLEKSSATDCTRDEKVRFDVSFSNRSPLFAFRIEAHFYTADLYGRPVSHAATTVAMTPFETYDMPFTTKFDHIGTYQAGLDRIVVYDFLRLFSWTIEGPKQTKVQVIPKLVPVPNLLFSNLAIVETTKAARTIFSDSMDYAFVREYVWGDPLKNIHWKLSARSDHYLTKLFETYTNPGVSVILDFYGPGQDAFELMRMFDCVVETGFSVARHAQTLGMETEIHYCDKRGVHVKRTTWRRSDLPEIVNDMPRFTNDPHAALDAIRILNNEAASIHGQNNIVVCTANLSSEMMESVVTAKVHRREPIVFAVIPKDLEGRERDQWLAPLNRLDAAGITYLVLTSSSDLLKVS